jgi:hypothetical protein
LIFKPAKEIETTGLPFHLLLLSTFYSRFEPEFKPTMRPRFLDPARVFPRLPDPLISRSHQRGLLLLVELADQLESTGNSTEGWLLDSTTLIDLDLNQPLLLIEEAEGLSELGLEEGEGQAEGPEAALGEREAQVARGEEGERGGREGGGQGRQGQEGGAV